MMTNRNAGYMGFGLVVGMFLGVIAGALFGLDQSMREAFERGHAVQCLGKTGYHWECEK